MSMNDTVTTSAAPAEANASSSTTRKGQMNMPPSSPSDVECASSTIVDLSRYLQLESPLFRLPLELRQMIYNDLFGQSMLYIGFSENGRAPGLQRPSRTLALLHTCQRARDEIGESWIGRVMFSFSDTVAMMTTLSRLAPERLGEIRHICVPGEPMFLRNDARQEREERTVGDALLMLPGLRLDELTVIAPRVHADIYPTLDGLVRRGMGWHELRYLTRDTLMLGLEDQFGRIRRLTPHKPAQPSWWQHELNRRDGADSGAHVCIYRATVLNRAEAVLDPATREPFEQTDTDWWALNLMRFPRAACLTETRALLTTVKRGDGVDYAVKDDPQDQENWPWDETKFEHVY